MFQVGHPAYAQWCSQIDAIDGAGTCAAANPDALLKLYLRGLEARFAAPFVARGGRSVAMTGAGRPGGGGVSLHGPSGGIHMSAPSMLHSGPAIAPVHPLMPQPSPMHIAPALQPQAASQLHIAPGLQSSSHQSPQQQPHISQKPKWAQPIKPPVFTLQPSSSPILPPAIQLQQPSQQQPSGGGGGWGGGHHHHHGRGGGFWGWWPWGWPSAAPACATPDLAAIIAELSSVGVVDAYMTPDPACGPTLVLMTTDVASTTQRVGPTYAGWGTLIVSA